MTTPQEDATEAERARERLEQAAMLLFVALAAQQVGGEESDRSLPRVDLSRLRQMLGELLTYQRRVMTRQGLFASDEGPGVAVPGNNEEALSTAVEALLPQAEDLVRALRVWAMEQPAPAPGELTLQRQAARTFATQTFNRSTEAVATSRPEGTPTVRKVWITRADNRVRKLHRRLHGHSKGLDGDFYRWTTGERLRFPGDPEAPLDATIGCRCVLLMTTMTAGQAVAEFPPLPDDTD